MKTVMLCLTMLVATPGCDAMAFNRLADVSIVDRNSGVVLTPHYYRGEYWVAGTPGARYAIEVHNRLGERLLAVTSVDGVNVVSGEDAAFNQAGYVFAPGERYQVTGWRKSDAEVAAFTFTAASKSYAERTGRPANIGVIGVAIFRERPPEAIDATPSIGGKLRYREAAPTAQAQADAPAPAADALSRGNSADAAAASRIAPGMMPAPAPVEKLGTGHGEREYAYIQRTEFVRLRPQPDEVIRIRYDSLENLIAMGIIPNRSIEGRPSPFPGSNAPGYVPDPPG